MGLERSDRDVHPVVEGQSVEETGELRFAVSAVQAEGPGLPGRGVELPQPDEMPFLNEAGRGGCLGAVTGLDLARRGVLGNVSNSTRNSMGVSSGARDRSRWQVSPGLLGRHVGGVPVGPVFVVA
jgi:hypothetical protein